MFDSLKAMDTVSLRFSQEGLLVLNLTLAFIMFGVALGIKVEHFTRLVKNPSSVIVGFLSQFVLLPVITFCLTAGTPIDRLQDAGGWASPAMPLHYVEAAKIANQGVLLG